MTDFILFAVFPYASLIFAAATTVLRYRRDPMSWTSRPTQFLENRWLFWGAAPWHYAILPILGAHILAALFPAAWSAFLGPPARIYALEATGIALGIAALAGLAVLLARRIANPRILAVTNAWDWIVVLLLLAQAATGLHIASAYRWGAVWYLHTATPWLRSLATLSPEVGYVSALPGVVKVHIVSAFVLVALLPFTRLVHLFSVPLSYLWRPYQLFAWNRRERTLPGRAL